MLICSGILNLVLALIVLILWSERKKFPKRDKSGRFKSKKTKQPVPDFFKNLTGDSK